MSPPSERKTGPQRQLRTGGKPKMIDPEDTAPEREWQLADQRNPPILESDGPISLAALRRRPERW